MSVQKVELSSQHAKYFGDLNLQAFVVLHISDLRLGHTPSDLQVDIDKALGIRRRGRVNLGSLYRDDRETLILVNSVEKQRISCIGFHKNKRNITVTQMQGVMGRQTKIRWEKLFLHLVCEFAFSSGFREVRVRPAKYNKWAPQLEEIQVLTPRNHEIPDIAEMYRDWEKRSLELYNSRMSRYIIRYDKTPERMGFKASRHKVYRWIDREKWEQYLSRVV